MSFLLCRRAGGRGAAALLLAALPAMASAQDGSGEGEAIIVTSLRRPEAIADAVGALTVFDRNAIRRNGVEDLRDIADRTPNFGMLDNYRPGLERFQLRGIVSPQVGDPPLAFVIDGVTAPDPEFATEPLFDIERVEILRGPQGALYGRSAVGGTVNIVTRAPGDRFALSAAAEYQSGDTVRLSGTVSGPIAGERLRFRLAGYRLESDGVIENRHLGTGADHRRDLGIAAQLAGALGPRTTFDLRARRTRARDGIGYYDAVGPTRAGIEDFGIATAQNVLGINRRDSHYLTAKIEHRFEAATLVLAGGFFHARDEGIADGDLVALPANGAGFAPSWQEALDDLDAWTGELRLTSSGSGPLRWALGGFFQSRTKFSIFSVREDPDGTRPLTAQDIAASPLLFEIQDRARSRTWAASAELTYALASGLDATLAGRYDRDARASVDPRDPIATDARATFARFQPKLFLSYRLSPSLLAFAGYSRGFRSGGFNQYSPVVPRDYPAEITDSLETGVRLAALDDRLTLAASLFRNVQSRAQITRFNPASFTLENVPIDQVRSHGAELELALRALPGLWLRFAGGITDSEITAFRINPAVEGASMPYVPDFTASFSLDHERRIGAAAGWAHAGYRLVGPRSFTLDFPDLKSRTHGFVDLRLGLRLRSWEISAFAENLLDERQPEDVFGVFNGAVELARQPNAGRRVGLSLRYGPR